MIKTFPSLFSNKAIRLYLILLAVVTVLFWSHRMQFMFMAFGLVEVYCFFHYASTMSIGWYKFDEELFGKRLFKSAFLIRLVYVIFAYFFFKSMTGSPFDFEAADSVGYHESADELATCNFGFVWHYLFGSGGELSDSGYVFYLTMLYKLTGRSILMARLVKAILGAWTCLLMFKLAYRNFGQETGKLTGIFCMLMPNMIYWCGMHNKEIEMVFLVVLFAERADAALRLRDKIDWKALITSLVAALMIFTLRTALAGVALVSLLSMVVFSPEREVKNWIKISVVTIMALGLIASAGTQIYQDTKSMVEIGGSEQEHNMEWRSVREGGNAFAKYANKFVFAPLIFTLPFPTMVNIDYQKNQQMIHGGNYVKNITSFFTIYALLMLLLSGKWRKHVLPIVLLCGYLFVLAVSQYAQSERFHMPALPFAMMFAAYGVVNIKGKHVQLFNYWTIGIFLANVAWAWFKLKGKGMI